MTTFIPVLKKWSVTCLNDYWPIALTFIMKCFEQLDMEHIKNSLFTRLDPYQNTYSPIHLTEDAIFVAGL